MISHDCDIMEKNRRMDLYLLHQPYGDVAGAWKALEDARKAGKIRSIGVSNMTPKIWNQWVPQFDIVPAVNQVECNSLFQQKELRKIPDEKGVKLEAWYPLCHGSKELIENSVIVSIAEKYGKNAGQVILRFEVQEGIIVLPKSTNPGRIAGNLNIFDFELTEEEMNVIREMDSGKGSHNPEADGIAEMLLSAFDVHQA